VARYVTHCQDGGATGEWEIKELYEWFVEWCHMTCHSYLKADGTCAVPEKLFQTSLTTMGIKSERKWVRVEGQRVSVSYRVIPEPIALDRAA